MRLYIKKKDIMKVNSIWKKLSLNLTNIICKCYVLGEVILNWILLKTRINHVFLKPWAVKTKNPVKKGWC